MKITVEQALIKTAAIEIKALTINNRQVTLALFRQLDYGELIDHALLRLNGPVWGRVNYHAPDCKGRSQHLHLIWQDGTELKQDTVRIGDFDSVKGAYIQTVEMAMEECVADALYRSTYWRPEWSGWSLTAVPGVAFYPSSNTLFRGLNNDLFDWYEGHAADLRKKKEAGESLTEWDEGQIKKRSENIQKTREIVSQKYPVVLDQSSEKLLEKLIAAKKELDAYKAGSQKLYQQLETVDHLFIAA